MTLYIIRHGESEADILKVHEGRADFPLTARGHRQAEAMAERLADSGIGRIYCSTLTRAMQTAEHLASALAVEPTPDEHLMEFNNGLLAGKSHEEAMASYPPVDRLPLHAAVYEQESQLAFRFRAEYMISKILSENAEDAVIAVVSHGGMINQLFRALLKLPPDCGIFFSTGDTGIHKWQIDGDSRRLIYANDTSHTNEI